ncbi:NAD(P)/FAD-dependent oxidoreductase [Aeromicrobium sp. CF4.19]|uniref:NAD(P)/FAD-dependent oxidoreductase n=1 Tax=Aeromicrobium sp. CF4.19 TaxID=3373082 RepID=UPI003EE5E4C5
MSRPDLPVSADVVVIGGGVMGLSAACHLAEAGVERVVVLERGPLGGGSTVKAAGGVRATFSDPLNIALAMRSLDALEQFGSERDQEIDLHRVGYLFLLDDPSDVETFTRDAELQQQMGLPSRMVSVQEAGRLSPLVRAEGLLGAMFSPRGGHCAPESVVLGYARAARRAGATILTDSPATGLQMAGEEILGVHTAAGTIATSTVVCAAGAWSREVGRWAGVDLPVEPLRRQVAITEPVPGLDPQTPFTIDFSTSFYLHGEGQGLLMGLPERRDSWGFDQSREPRWLEDLAEAIEHRAPSLADVGIAAGWAGLYEMTPDCNALIGRSATVSGLVYACGFSGHGFLMGPAVGEVVRDLVLGARPFVDVGALAVERFADSTTRPETAII